MPLTVNAGSVRRSVFSLLPLVLICMGAPLCAQLTYTGVLDHIEITKHPPYCTGSGTPITEKVPASAGASVSFTVTCGPSSTKLDLTVAFPLTTSKAKATDPHFPEVVEFEEGVRTGFRANATFSHDAASGWNLSYFVPSCDLSPQPGVPEAAGTCEDAERKGGAAKGQWTSSLNMDCTRAKKQNMEFDRVQRIYYFHPWTEIHTDLFTSPQSKAPPNQSYIVAVPWYKMTVAGEDKATISSVSPAAGARQDPSGVMKDVQATVDYELNTRDNGAVVLVAEDDKGTILRLSSQAGVLRGKGTVRLNILNFGIPADAVELRVTAQLLTRENADVLAKSAITRYPVEVDLKVDHVEAIQVVQDAKNGIPLAANRPTWLRFFGVARQLNTSIDGVPWQVRAYRDGRELGESPMFLREPGSFLSTEVDRRDLSVLYAMAPTSWSAPGATEFRVEINPRGQWHMNESNMADNSYSFTATFQERPPLDVRYQLICIEPPGETPACAKGSHDGLEMLAVAALFPMQPDKASYEALPIPPKRWPYPMNTTDDWDRLILEMQFFYDLQTKAGAAYQQLIGWLPAESRATVEDGTPLRGLTLPAADGGSGRILLAPERAANESEAGEAFVVAHEMGHNFGLTHGYPQPACSNKNPTLVTGEIGLYAGQLLDIDAFHLMTACSATPGVTPAQYLTVWQSGFQPLAVPPPESGAAAAKGQPAAEAQSGQCVLVQGAVSREAAGGRFDKVLRVDCAEAPKPAGAGNHCLRFLDASDARLGEWCFPVSFTMRETTALRDERRFYVKAPLPPGTVKMVLVRGEQELASRSASSNPPQVQFTAPAAGDRWSGGGLMELAWTASDADGDTLTYGLQYSFDEGASWLPIEAALTEPRYSLDPRYIQGGKKILFRVIANDGFLASSADAGPVEIAQVPAVEVSADPLDFLNVMRGHVAVSMVTIRNSGSGPLTVQSAAAPAPFGLRDAAPFRIAAGAARSVPVQFAPTAVGNFSGSLKLTTDDPAKPTLQILLAGAGVDSNTPEIEVTPASLDFGSVGVGKTADVVLRVRNRGPAPLNLQSAVTRSAGFRVAGLDAAAVLKAGETVKLTVTFAPTTTGSTTGSVAITSSDPKRGTVTVQLKGAGA